MADRENQERPLRLKKILYGASGDPVRVASRWPEVAEDLVEDVGAAVGQVEDDLGLAVELQPAAPVTVRVVVEVR